ncbi:dNTP-hexose glycosyl transferase [Nocardiopsis kunsanensis]|uniref:DNTP-hexose glycosyl transferase n=1 Tax=Nocardiopsis kunsanensis TaxID=141693 RepID=A0A918X809_9ACTN|nr:nucleotide disphospho-sugar-binding domain-containing protein [Nocardiopsis kunsanensis]GHD17609.1 dNTP-hexose glycosyl transferase [Nocardiopsis kunsanensis]
MKVLFVPGNSPYPVYSHTPLATSLRNAGHQVFMGGIDWVLPKIAAMGLPPVKIAPLTVEEVASFVSSMPSDPEESARAVGGVYARIALDSLDTLTELAENWRPDIVVGGGMFYCAPLFAHRIGVPSVRLEWDRLDTRMYDPGSVEVLRPALEKEGLERVPDPDLWLDVCPPSLSDPSAPRTQPMQWMAANPQRPLEPWMYVKPDRPRIYVTAGTRLQETRVLREMADHVTGLGAEIVIGAPEDLVEPLSKEVPEARVGWFPLDVLAPTCDLIVHHGGGGTDMTALKSGVPQLVVDPEYPTRAVRVLDEYGAAITLIGEEASPEAVGRGVREILLDTSFRQRSRELASEMSQMPKPAEIVPLMEELAARGVG